MPRGNYRQAIKCAEPECGETVIYHHQTRADEAASIRAQRERPWKCVRHLWPDKMLSAGREVITAILTVTPRTGAARWEKPSYWDGPGTLVKSDRADGPGFQAFASDWPEGTRLEVTARILPPTPERDSGEKTIVQEGVIHG